MNSLDRTEERSDRGCANLRWSLALVDGLVGGGVRQLVLSPGSRSTPLVLAAQRHPHLELIPILDERSAAFFALGLARASGHPVGLVCTSGSAPAHWLPAVMEASESELPLLLLSADRPPELRAWGANQTIDQTRLFGVFVREFHDPGPPDDTLAGRKAMRALGARAAAVSLGRRRGPVHINLCYPEPLVPAEDCEADLEATAGPVAADKPGASALMPLGPAASHPMPAGHGLILCGPGSCPPGFANALWACAENLALPVLLDPLSGMRFGAASPRSVARYDSFLRNEKAARALRPDWVLRFGGPPVSKTLTEWLRGIPTVLVDPGARWRDPTHDCHMQVDADPIHFCNWLVNAGGGNEDWSCLDLWREAERRVDSLIEDYLQDAAWCEPHLIRALLDWLPPETGLFCANSLPIRQLDTWSGTRSAPLRVFGNRGVSGIDGNLSTLAGLNAAGVPTLGLLGDLALFHDLSGLLQVRWVRLPLVVINNGGGRIFDYLPQRRLNGLETLWRMPVDVDIAALARPFGLCHERITDAMGLRAALGELASSCEPALLEVTVDAERSQRVHQDFWRRLRQEPIISA